MSEEELATIEARAAGTTPGPWEASEDWEFTPSGKVFKRVNEQQQNVIAFTGYASQRNTGFIAAAREDVPRLIAEIRRLRMDLKRHRGLLARIAQQPNAFIRVYGLEMWDVLEEVLR